MNLSNYFFRTDSIPVGNGMHGMHGIEWSHGR